MFRIVACIGNEHDLRLVVVAGVIALTGSYTTLTLLLHVRGLAGAARRLWLGAAALTAGSAIWATHFVAMLAFQLPVKVGYAVDLTALSLLIAVLMTGAGLWLAVLRASRAMQAASGAVIGLAVSVMHYTGMSALLLPGTLSWDFAYVVASVVAGCVLAAVAVPLALAGGGWRRAASALLLTTAICATHFTGMTAVSITLSNAVPSSAVVLSPPLLAANVAIASALILLLSIAGLVLDRRSVQQREVERLNLRDLADIAIEGLLVCDNGRVSTANTSFEQMAGFSAAGLIGSPVDDLFDPAVTSDAAAERMLVSSTGERIPVEVVCKPILYSGRPHQVMAVRDLRERLKAEQDIRFLAHHDSLTGLENRAAFGLALDRQLCEQARHGQPFALLALDLDRFKEVNDTLGHQTGDLLLKRVADRLRAMVRETDVVARLGGDEFAILSASPTSPTAAAALASRAVEMVRRPYILDGKVVNIAVSVGVALAPQDGDTATTLTKNADLALYRAKQDGRDTTRFFEPDMDQRMQNRRTLQLELRQALSHDQLEVFYQPLFDVGAQRVRGFEALVRWRHPERGLVPPGDFIPLAEETGLIVPIGAFVLNTAVMQAAAWGGEITVAVNLSAVQFGTGTLVQTVRTALSTARLPAHRLELEITESVLLGEGGDTIATLHALRDLGVRIAMDDFGTGYSSLSYLRAFPFDKIKIDRSFVQEMLANKECAAIIQAVLGLGQSLGITITAEGVETKEQMAHLTRQGCDVVQGYLVGKPSTAGDAARFLVPEVAEAA